MNDSSRGNPPAPVSYSISSTVSITQPLLCSLFNTEHDKVDHQQEEPLIPLHILLTLLAGGRDPAPHQMHAAKTLSSMSQITFPSFINGGAGS